MDVRRAGPADLDALVAQHERFCAVDGHPFDARRARLGFGALLADDQHGVVWLASSGYAVVTWGWSIEAGGAEAVLDEVFVEERGEGVGTALIEHLLADCRARGLARVFLETESHNERVRRLYERHGFVVDDSVWMSHEFVDLN
ncbi:MAG: GNAT family N-acetyltransferase [Ilumatobacteraceae bacterium]